MSTANPVQNFDSLSLRSEPIPSRTEIANKCWSDLENLKTESTNLIDISNQVRTTGGVTRSEFIKKKYQGANELVARNFREEIKQVWLGTLVDFNDEHIVARLEDCTDYSNPVEEVTLSIEEIEEQDRELIEIGAQVYWHIGYRFGRNYSRERFSKIRFRRLAKWSQEELSDAAKLTEEYLNFFAQSATDSP